MPAQLALAISRFQLLEHEISYSGNPPDPE
jgi:hypothetical protein